MASRRRKSQLQKDLDKIEDLQHHTMVVMYMLSQNVKRFEPHIKDTIRKQAVTLGLCLAMLTRHEEVLLGNIASVANEMLDAAQHVWAKAEQEAREEAANAATAAILKAKEHV